MANIVTDCFIRHSIKCIDTFAFDEGGSKEAQLNGSAWKRERIWE